MYNHVRRPCAPRASTRCEKICVHQWADFFADAALSQQYLSFWRRLYTWWCIRYSREFRQAYRLATLQGPFRCWGLPPSPPELRQCCATAPTLCQYYSLHLDSAKLCCITDSMTGELLQLHRSKNYRLACAQVRKYAKIRSGCLWVADFKMHDRRVAGVWPLLQDVCISYESDDK